MSFTSGPRRLQTGAASSARTRGRGKEKARPPIHPTLAPGRSDANIGALHVFLAAIVLLPPLQAIFGTRPLGWPETAMLCVFPVVVWSADELRRARIRRRSTAPARTG
jgi:hypothetical protein